MDVRATAAETPSAEELLAHRNALLSYALTRVGDRATAEDLVQETLVTAVTKLGDFAGGSSMRTWLTGILRHKILDHFRWKVRHPGDAPNVEEPESEDADPWFNSLGVWRTYPSSSTDTVERSQLREALQLCIDKLPKSLHRVFVLRELEELEPEATCEVAGISRESLAVFLYRARQSLRDCMQKHWVDT